MSDKNIFCNVNNDRKINKILIAIDIVLTKKLN